MQKSLYNLLWAIDGKYDITLCLFKKIGAYVENLPPSVKVVEVCGAFRFLGISQGECSGLTSLKRGILAALSRVIGRKKVLGMMKCRQPELEEKYDCAVSYLHNGRPKSFYGGTQDFVLNCINADRKVAFLHGDYRNCGSDNPENNSQMEQFDKIAACSDGCRDAFVSVLPQLKDKCVTVRNCHRFDEILERANDDPLQYDRQFVNIIMVTRLSHEKGIERAIKAVSNARAKCLPVKLHIVGGGAKTEDLRKLAQDEKIEGDVIFYGEQINPYRYMKNADLLLITSYHEAAPMVIDEARALGVPILTTETTSSKDMVSDRECGWVCDNSQEAINDILCAVVSNKENLVSMKQKLLEHINNNSIAIAQFDAMLN